MIALLSNFFTNKNCGYVTFATVPQLIYLFIVLFYRFVLFVLSGFSR